MSRQTHVLGRRPIRFYSTRDRQKLPLCKFLFLSPKISWRRGTRDFPTQEHVNKHAHVRNSHANLHDCCCKFKPTVHDNNLCLYAEVACDTCCALLRDAALEWVGGWEARPPFQKEPSLHTLFGGVGALHFQTISRG